MNNNKKFTNLFDICYSVYSQKTRPVDKETIIYREINPPLLTCEESKEELIELRNYLALRVI